jgi:hypothetical protein
MLSHKFEDLVCAEAHIEKRTLRRVLSGGGTMYSREAVEEAISRLNLNIELPPHGSVMAIAQETRIR